jgi:hypothetical protein
MSSDHVNYRNRWLSDPTNPDNNDAAQYGVEIHRMNNPNVWRVLGVHHLTPSENQGKHNVYVDVVGPKNQASIGWTWIGRKADEANPNKPLDKPTNEPNGNVDLYPGMNAQVWVDDLNMSDRVFGLRTDLPEGKGPNGEIWNSYGHHSYYILFSLMNNTIPPVINDDSAELQRVRKELSAIRVKIDYLINSISMGS